MLTDPERSLIMQAQALLAQSLGAPSTPLITTEADFDAAYAAAVTGSTLALAQDFVYSKHLVIDKSVVILGPSISTGRMTKDETLPTFQNGIEAPADAVGLKAIAARNQGATDEICVLRGINPSIARCRFQGDPVNGARRGVNASGTNMLIVQSYFDDIFSPNDDTQAVGSWDMGGGLTLDDDYFAASGEGVMFGGADSSSLARMPRRIVISNSTFMKNTSWYQRGMVIKNGLEFKACDDATVYNCVFQGAGSSGGQGNYLIVATVRNQDGGAPWSTITNIRIHNCIGNQASGLCNILGSDDVNPSGTMDGLSITDCQFTQIDWGSPGRLFAFDRAPKNVTLNNISVQGANLSAWGYFSGAAPVGLVMGGMSLPPATYGWKIDGGGQGRTALQAYAADARLDATII